MCQWWGPGARAPDDTAEQSREGSKNLALLPCDRMSSSAAAIMLLPSEIATLALPWTTLGIA